MPYSHDVKVLNFEKYKDSMKILFNLRYYETDEQTGTPIEPDIIDREVPITYNPSSETAQEVLARALAIMQNMIDEKKQYAPQLASAETYLNNNLVD